MPQYAIRPVEKHDLPLLDIALRALSGDLGDTHPASVEFLEQAGFGSTPAYYALLALNDDDILSGAVVFSPLLSTTLGATGCFVSDLWVSDKTRGRGLGRRLLAEAVEFAQAHWGAGYLKLAVYDGSFDARQFYQKLGFVERGGETTLFLDKTGLDALKGTA
jgi:ribosomal protein S18 acetylase RimI-like enzyme